MKFPSFHLSTLILLVIFAGSLIGLCFTPPIWQELSNREAHALHLPNSVQFTDFSSFGDPARASYDAETDEETRFDVEARVWSLVLIDNKTGAESIVFSQNHPRPICCLGFSKDKRFLFKDDESEWKFFRRTRPYGWRGWLHLPLFWVALVSLIPLSAICLRHRRVTQTPRPITN